MTLLSTRNEQDRQAFDQPLPRRLLEDELEVNP